MHSSTELASLRDVPVLVTGGSGFVGAALVRQLVAIGARVSVITRSRLHTGRLADVAHAVTRLERDLRTLPPTPPVAWPVPRVIFHLAALGVDPLQDDLSDLVQANVVMTARVLGLATAWQVDRFVHFGSCGEYGSCRNASEETLLAPDSAYGATKAASTLLVRAVARGQGLSAVVLRPFSVYGPLENPHRLVSTVAAQALRGDTILFTEGRQTRDFIFVDDVVHAAVAAAVNKIEPGEVFNVCTGVETAVRDLILAVLELTGGGAEVRFGVRSHPATEMWRNSGNPAKAWARLGWAPRVPLREGLSRTIEWLRTSGFSRESELDRV